VGVVVLVGAMVVGGGVVAATQSGGTVVGGIDVVVSIGGVRVVLPTIVKSVEGPAPVVTASESLDVATSDWGDEQLATPTMTRDRTATEIRLATVFTSLTSSHQQARLSTHLRDDLAAANVIVNREVQIRAIRGSIGERTDVLVGESWTPTNSLARRPSFASTGRSSRSNPATIWPKVRATRTPTCCHSTGGNDA
jgi:hypothetical protein